MKFRVIKTTVAMLAKNFGGKWKYDRRAGQWNCNDGNRYVVRVATGRDLNGEYDGTSSNIMYFRDNSELPVWVYK